MTSIKKTSLVIIFLFLLTSIGCVDPFYASNENNTSELENTSDIHAAPEENPAEEFLIDNQHFRFDFTVSSNGWNSGFSDYPKGSEPLYNLTSKWLALPDPLSGLNGIYLSGDNRSDDLFMYIKRKISGLKPNAKYSLIINLQIASNSPSGCIGAGGAPGESVFVKVGSSPVEPVSDREAQGFLRMNLDHGYQGNSGEDAVVVGNISTVSIDCYDKSYRLKELNNALLPIEDITSSDGSLWVIIGTDSGFEGTTSLYHTFAEVSLLELAL